MSAFDTSAEPVPARAAGRRRPRWIRALVAVAVLLCLALLATAIFGAFLVESEAGRRLVGQRLERLVSNAIPGSITIGALTRLDSGSAVLSDLRFHHPDGSVVLYTKRAEIDFDALDFVRGRIEFERARVDGGFLIIAVQPDGRTTLESAFDDPGPGTGEPAQIDLRAMHVQDLTLVLRPAPDTTFHLRDVEGFVVVSQHGPPGVRVRLDAIRAKVAEPKILGEKVELLRADGWIHGGAAQILELDLQAKLAEERFSATLAYHEREKEAVVLRLDAEAGFQTQLAALSAEMQSWFSRKVDVRVD